jgi:predicted nucleic acid-binding protein
MGFVVDPSVIIAALVKEPQRRALIGVTQGAHLLAPPSAPWEAGSALSAMIRRKRLTVAEALKAVAAYLRN